MTGGWDVRHESRSTDASSRLMVIVCVAIVLAFALLAILVTPAAAQRRPVPPEQVMQGIVIDPSGQALALLPSVPDSFRLCQLDYINGPFTKCKTAGELRRGGTN